MKPTTGQRDLLIATTVADGLGFLLYFYVFLFSGDSSPGSSSVVVLIACIGALRWACIGFPIVAWSIMGWRPKAAFVVAALPLIPIPISVAAYMVILTIGGLFLH
jgi:hypothetical protein